MSKQMKTLNGYTLVDEEARQSIANGRITTRYLSIAAGDLAETSTYDDAVSVPNNSGVILVSPANKSTSEICSEYLVSISYTGEATRYTFKSDPAKTMSFRYVIIPTDEGSVVPVFDACWSKNVRHSYLVSILEDTADKTAQEIFEMIQAGINVAALRNGNEYYYYAGAQVNTDQTIKSVQFVSTRVDDSGSITTYGITIDTSGDTTTWQNVSSGSSNILTDTVTSKKYTFEITDAKLILKEVT